MDDLTFVYRDETGVMRRKQIELPGLCGILSAEGLDRKYLEICTVYNTSVRLNKDLVEHANLDALENALTEEVNDAMNRLPWTSDCFTKAEFADWLATRKAAGAIIDIETCELGRWAAYDVDPYGARPDLPEEMQQVGTNRYVRSPESRGWINEEDLPPEMVGAMYDRIHREYEAWAKDHPEKASQRRWRPPEEK